MPPTTPSVHPGLAEGVPEGEPCGEGGFPPYANHKTVTPSATGDDTLAPSATGDEEGQGLVGEGLVDFDSRQEFGLFVAKMAGLRIELDAKQTWKVGGCQLVVSFRLDQVRQIVFMRVHDGWPDVPAEKSLALAEVYATAITRQVRRLEGKGEFPRWKRRALAEAGLITLPPAQLRPLPDDASEDERQTWEKVIAPLVAVRRLTEPPGTPVALSAPWLVGWSGVDENVIKRGKRRLERRGFIEHVADHPVGKGRPLYLWAIAGDEPPADNVEDSIA